MSLRTYVKDRLRLFLAAIGVGVIALVFIWASVALVPQKQFDHINPKLGRFAFVTIVFIVYWLRMYWWAHKHFRFWLVLLAILIVHFLAVGYIFYSSAGLLLLVITVAAESALLALAVYYFPGIGPPVQKH